MGYFEGLASASFKKDTEGNVQRVTLSLSKGVVSH
jgi:hypothetical protein